MVFGLLTAVGYIALAFIEPTYATLLGGVFLITVLLQFAAGAAAGLASGVGNHHAMTGQMSTVMNTATLAPVVLAALLGGQLAFQECWKAPAPPPPRAPCSSWAPPSCSA